MRKLASVQKIISVNPIEGADVIVRAQVLGWNLVTQKSNDFKPGDLVIYHEVDALLPEGPEYDFMAKAGLTTNADGTQGYRLRTIKLKGVISQGLILPLSLLSHKLPEGYVPKEGDELTEYLGIKKYEAKIPAELQGIAKGEIPSLVPKTDEERVQNLQPMLDEINGTEGYAAIKVDGASMTLYVIDDENGVCSRNTDFIESDENTQWKLAHKLDLHTKMREIAKVLGIKNIALQGEIYGEGIQGNKLKKVGQHFAAFNLYDIDNARYLDFTTFIASCRRFDIPTVKILSDSYILHNDIERYLKEADEAKYENGAQAEGIVFRSKGYEKWNGQRISFKAIGNKFLLKHGE